MHRPDGQIMTGYRVAFDAGRPEGRACGHLDNDAAAESVAPAASGCTECVRAGAPWAHLRLCLTCGHVGCCDSSRGKHAAAHAAETGHPLARSLEKGEDWAWCYQDELFLTPHPGPPPGVRSTP
ncbi:UBP-type zinc finger domain-containing protein [Streptomyces sp. NPDC091267]|uniref:UBP-type zinc finger domain-containing protein n=1 Tax=Streptomyces sp. NPDC091267 TaxID=3155195 RepID=UPI00342D4F1F